MTRSSRPFHRGLLAAACLHAGGQQVIGSRTAWADAGSAPAANGSRHDAASRRSHAPENRVAVPLPALRRVGVEPVTHDLEEARALLSRDRAAAEEGIAALPYTREQLSLRLSEITERALDASGRYFVVSLEGTRGGTAASALASGDAAKLASARERLRRDYDLDAWLSVDLAFSPDQVRLRVAMKGASAATEGRVLAREDMFLRPDASEKEIHEGLLTALGRLGRTLGHDGKVTSLREDLVTLDFGSERGLAAGSRVELGLVVLSAFHPVSGEFLRHRNVVTHVVEVVDARQGTSIARIVQRNRSVAREAAALFAGGREEDLALLAWREEKRPKLAGQGRDPWETPREVVIAPLSGVAGEGFEGDRESRGIDERSDAGFLSSLLSGLGGEDTRKGPRNETRGAVTKGTRTADASDDADADRARGDATQDEGAKDDGQGRRGETREERGARFDDDSDSSRNQGEPEPEGDPQGRQGSRRRERPDGQDDFRLLSARAGAGTTFGILSTDRGDRYTDFPSTVLNTIVAGAHVALPSKLESDPELAVRFFSGGDVEGSEVTLKAPVLTTVASFAGDGRFLAGGEVHVNSGGVKTIRVKKDLGEFALLGTAVLERRLAGFGDSSLSAGVSVFGLFGGHVQGFARASIAPSGLLPKALSFYGRASSGPEKWSAFEFGATWTFLEHAR